MAKTTADKEWHPIDIDEICRLFETSKEGNEVRQRNTAEAIRAIAGPLKHCLGNSTRVIARQSIPMSTGRRTTRTPPAAGPLMTD
jgi:hypothetical protein